MSTTNIWGGEIVKIMRWFEQNLWPNLIIRVWRQVPIYWDSRQKIDMKTCDTLPVSQVNANYRLRIHAFWQFHRYAMAISGFWKRQYRWYIGGSCNFEIWKYLRIPVDIHNSLHLFLIAEGQYSKWIYPIVTGHISYGFDLSRNGLSLLQTALVTKSVRRLVSQ